MADKKKITISIMDGPFESARTVTALRLVDIAARRGYDVTVFAYEGAVGLAFSKQAPHANAVHGHDVEEEDHPLPKEWISSLIETAKQNGGSIDWINCGLCVDERGVAEAVPNVRRGSPADLWKASLESDGTLIMAVK